MQQGQQALDEEDSVYLSSMLRRFADGSLTLKDSKPYKRVAEIQREIDSVSSQYSQALNAKDGMWLTMDELRGIPESIAQPWSAEGGRCHVPLNAANYEAILGHADSEEMRRKMAFAFNNCAEDTNITLLHRLIVLRDEQARLLGYKHFTDWKSEERMMNPERAVQMSEDAAAKLKSAISRRIARLKTHKADQTQEMEGERRSSADTLFTWAMSYY